MDETEKDSLAGLKRPELVRKACEAFGPTSGNPLAFTNAQLRTALITGEAPDGWKGGLPNGAPAAAFGMDADAHFREALRLLAAEIGPKAAPLDEERVRAISQEEAGKSLHGAVRLLEARVSRPVSIAIGERPAVDVGIAHRQLPELVQHLADGNHVLLTGGAGSGKTHAAEQAAKALGVEHEIQSFCAQTTLSSMLGFISAGGAPIRTPLWDAVEHGRLFIGDEFDAASANTALAINAATANNSVTFASGKTAVHRAFRCVLTANTTGQGASVRYVGRNQLDAATLDRFVVLHWTYDEQLESALYGDVPAWVSAVQALRRGLDSIDSASRPRTVIGRAIKQGAPAARRGEPLSKLLDTYVWTRVSREDRAAIERAAS